MSRSWSGTGPAYDIAWGGRTWTLRVDEARPGLRSREAGLGPLLSLDGVAAPGRWVPEALSGATLIGCECRLERVEATYMPLGWGALRVRASWEPAGPDGIDLEVQVSAQTVGELRAVEVQLRSTVVEPSGASPRWLWVDPRDGAAAGLSYDGREPDLSRLITRPPRELLAPLPPWSILGPSRDAPRYVELARSEDVARRIVAGPRDPVRYGLFGHDLEKGVVLRARLRGLWLAGGPEAEPIAVQRAARFLQEPLPLGP